MKQLNYILEFRRYDNVRNTIRELVSYGKHIGVDVNIIRYNNDTILLDTIDSNIKGAGTMFMKHMCDLCDENELNITLIPAQSSKRSRSWLIEWYKCFGFVITNDPKYKFMVRFHEENK